MCVVYLLTLTLPFIQHKLHEIVQHFLSSGVWRCGRACKVVEILLPKVENTETPMYAFVDLCNLAEITDILHDDALYIGVQ